MYWGSKGGMTDLVPGEPFGDQTTHRPPPAYEWHEQHASARLSASCLLVWGKPPSPPRQQPKQWVLPPHPRGSLQIITHSRTAPKAQQFRRTRRRGTKSHPGTLGCTRRTVSCTSWTDPRNAWNHDADLDAASCHPGGAGVYHSMEEKKRFLCCTWGLEGCLDCEVHYPKHSPLKGWLSFVSWKQRERMWPQTAAEETIETTQRASKDKLAKGMGTQWAAVMPTSAVSACTILSTPPWKVATRRTC